VKRSILLSSIFVLLASSISSAADFTADMVISARGEKDTQGKVYMQGVKMRMEMGAPNEDDKVITITRPDKKLVWVMMPEEKMYMEQPYQEDPKMKEWTPAQEAKSKFIGKETVSGLECKKYQLEGEQTFYWISDKISFPVKTQAPEGTMVLKNIQPGKISGGLFEIPGGFEKFSMPGMGGMPQGVPGMPKGR